MKFFTQEVWWLASQFEEFWLILVEIHVIAVPLSGERGDYSSNTMRSWLREDKKFNVPNSRQGFVLLAGINNSIDKTGYRGVASSTMMGSDNFITGIPIYFLEYKCEKGFSTTPN